ncbi:MAG: hypothetical protein AB1938_12865 [Myxococcota bacterium]
MRRRLALALLAGVALQACGTCADLGAKKPFPCSQDAGDAEQCAEGWSCGFEGKCIDRTASAGRDYECVDSARHCADAWRCGAPDETGTRRCQQLDAGAPYPCLSNADCEADWRCDPVVRRCTEVDDQLSATKLSTVLVDRVSPRLPISMPSFVAVGQVQMRPPPDNTQPVGRVVGLVSDGGLFVITLSSKYPVWGASPWRSTTTLSTKPTSGSWRRWGNAWWAASRTGGCCGGTATGARWSCWTPASPASHRWWEAPFRSRTRSGLPRSPRTTWPWSPRTCGSSGCGPTPGGPSTCRAGRALW